jgi:hypothetical protein
VRTNSARWVSITVVAVLFAALLANPTALLSAPFASDKHQAPYALIYATVWGKGAETVYGVKVQLRRAGNKKVIAEQVSNHTGEVAFRVPAGKQDYTLTADVKLSKDKAKPEATAHVENDERVEVSLHLTE